MKRIWFAAALFVVYALPQLGWMTNPGNLGYMIELPVLALFFWMVAGIVYRSSKLLKVLLLSNLVVGILVSWLMLDIAKFALGLLLLSTIVLVLAIGVTYIVLYLIAVKA